MPATTEKLPHWDLSNIYSGLGADDFKADFEKLKILADELDEFITANNIVKLDKVPDDIPGTAKILDEFIVNLSEAHKILGTLIAYVYSFVTTDSYNNEANKKNSELENLQVRFMKHDTRLQAWVGSLGPVIDQIKEHGEVSKEHGFVLDEIVEQSKYLMDTQLEDLASELSLSGGGSMWKLQGTVTSQIKVPFELDGETRDMPITMIRNLANNPDGAVRKRAYDVELQSWDSVRESVAFSLNCVKGNAITLAKWRGRDGVLHEALDHNRIEKETLDALLGAMKDSFPVFRRYLNHKATKLGKEKLPWWDLFAPVGDAEMKYTYGEMCNYVIDQFGSFTPEMADFARNAFENNWIDAEPRDGKRGGAFCMGIPAVEESRILANFDGSFDQLTTMAHELGHAWHNYCQKGLPLMRKGAPMTLAETASIFCETIVFNAALESATDEQKITILENQLMGATQVVVDIYSRYIFESEIVKRRAEAELSVAEFCDIMIGAQKETYGDGLDQEHLHKYMWLLKPHYYYSDAHFYNYPYAFGLLFALGIYARYLNEGADFVPQYKELLRSTGEDKVAPLAARFDIDVRSKDFWASSIKVIEAQIDQYCEL
ncbi:MAG TPA: M3 family oligoendopeptidase [bacterium]|jgi:pepF/M3 family oligoendopeptidase